jgi:hypothetical protein
MRSSGVCKESWNASLHCGRAGAHGPTGADAAGGAGARTVVAGLRSQRRVGEQPPQPVEVGGGELGAPGRGAARGHDDRPIGCNGDAVLHAAKPPVRVSVAGRIGAVVIGPVVPGAGLAVAGWRGDPWRPPR